MADFRLEPAIGVDVESYRDPNLVAVTPEGIDRAGRLGEVPVAPHRHLVAVRHRLVEVHAILDDEEEPRLDATLASRPFRSRWAEAPDGGPMIITPGGGSAFIRFIPTSRGHYVLHVRRKGSGGAMIHFDVET